MSVPTLHCRAYKRGSGVGYNMALENLIYGYGEWG